MEQPIDVMDLLAPLKIKLKSCRKLDSISLLAESYIYKSGPKSGSPYRCYGTTNNFEEYAEMTGLIFSQQSPIFTSQA